MRASNKRNTALIWTGIGAATAGIVAVVTILRLRENKHNEIVHRDINAVIEDCYRKINEIEEHLPSQQSTRRRNSAENSLANN